MGKGKRARYASGGQPLGFKTKGQPAAMAGATLWATRLILCTYKDTRHSTIEREKKKKEKGPDRLHVREVEGRDHGDEADGEAAHEAREAGVPDRARSRGGE
jgi:hypothetical protein